eukprot:TRINITY_DN22519_c0_g1_i2.p1 TRINITY_DN22519_c0_g1~~TRINITY_DN22519_c0_g1_i2.p1  ORF type:complete len:126 (+),score=31.15 TRINITY_DN22519_c0_g1_i2:186-563(+)
MSLVGDYGSSDSEGDEEPATRNPGDQVTDASPPEKPALPSVAELLPADNSGLPSVAELLGDMDKPSVDGCAERPGGDANAEEAKGKSGRLLPPQVRGRKNAVTDDLHKYNTNHTIKRQKVATSKA